MTNSSSDSDPLLTEIGEILAREVRPELVLLFGSRATGDARSENDYDLMVVVRDPGAVEAARMVAIAALRARSISASVHSRSVADYEARHHDAALLDWTVARHSRVLFSTGRVPQLSQRPRRLHEPPAVYRYRSGFSGAPGAGP